ncbi:hypothetical protein [Nocardioides pacificus]
MGETTGPQKKGPQRWELTVEGREHRVDIRVAGLSRELTWYVDGVEVVRRKSSDDKVRLVPPEDAAPPGLPDLAVAVRCSTFGGPRRVTLFSADEGDGGAAEGTAAAQAALGLGGLDLLPEPGSRAARREEMIRLHPQRYLLLRTAGGVATVVVPLVLGLLAVRFAVSLPWPSIPWPDIPLPSIPWPSIPWPEIPWPEIPWPDWSLPSWQLPGWLRWILDHAKYVWPVVLAAVLARGEVNRRRKQDALRTAAATPTAGPRTTEEPRTTNEL